MSAKFTCTHSDHKLNENTCLDWELQCEDNILTILSNPLPELCIIFWMSTNWQLVSYSWRQSPATPANQHLKLETLEHETQWSWKRGREIFYTNERIGHRNLTPKNSSAYAWASCCFTWSIITSFDIPEAEPDGGGDENGSISLSPLPKSSFQYNKQPLIKAKRIRLPRKPPQAQLRKPKPFLLKRPHPNLPSQTKRCNKHFKRMQSIRESNREG